jgi:hypothetical protein
MTQAIGVTLDAAYTAAEMTANGRGFTVGTRHETHDGKVYVFVQANGAITGDGYVVSIDESYQAIMTDTDTAASVAEGQSVGVAECAFEDDDFGWVQIFGACGIRTEQDAAANGKLGPTADAGQVDDAGAAGSKYIQGMTLGTATGGADAVNTTGWLNYPIIQLVGTYA